jgi:hypothetical protein
MSQFLRKKLQLWTVYISHELRSQKLVSLVPDDRALVLGYSFVCRLYHRFTIW